jgi:DNA-binding SARP family transcriptional activator/predicted negative regulator of RcsB-dependent stress response
MDYRILGPLEVREGERAVVVGGPKQRTLLVTLLLHSGRVVSMDQLVEVLWGPDPPKTAITQVQGLVSQLRRALATEGGQPPRLLTRHPGYLLQVEPGELDLDSFDTLCDSARRDMADGRVAKAAEQLRGALRLWRGRPLGGVDSTQIGQVEVPRLEERRLTALEERIQADLELGRHAELIAECQALVAEYPFRERLRGALMLALYRSGRQAEALEVYRRARQVLGEELGIDPGGELRNLEQAILRGDASLDQVAPPRGQHETPSPAQLPADIPDFTGRAKQVSQICDLLGDENRNRSAVVISAVAGKPGVGKTTLAVHSAHLLADDFPDGQLYVNLRGAQAQPLEPLEVLERFLRALGVDGAAIPDGLDQRSELYRSTLAGRQVLVVLDNAVTEGQVRPLLPGSAGCAVLVTSRSRLAGLDGARQLDLDILEPDQSVELLGRLLGRDRVEQDPGAAEKLAQLCGHLPLALRVAGARLTARPHWSLARLVDRLADERYRLDELAAADIEVRASLALSYAGLPGDQQRTLRLLGRIEAPDFACWVPAALLDVTVEAAEDLVESLVDAQLLDVVGEDATGTLRYRLHDLIKVYARERAEVEEPAEAVDAALSRLFGAWLCLADAASDRMLSGVPRPAHSGTPRWPIGDGLLRRLLADPRAWFEAEHACSVATVEQASMLDFHEAAWDLATSLVSAPMIVASRFDDWQRISEIALAAVRRADNRYGEAVLLCGLGLLRYSQERYGDAEDCSERARRIFTELGEPHGAAIGAYGLGAVWHRQGRFADAAGVLGEALRAFQAHGDLAAVACTRRHLGWLHYTSGAYDEALSVLDQALRDNRKIADRRGEGYVSYWIGLTLRAKQQDADSREYFDAALASLCASGDRIGEALATQAIAALDVADGELEQARVQLDAAMTVFRRLNNGHGEALTNGTLGELCLAEGDRRAARDHLERAARGWQQLRMPVLQARSLRRLGEVHAHLGDELAAEVVRGEAARLVEPAGSAG